MAKTKTWEDFLETKNANSPPQGKGSAPYHAPHTQNTGKVEVKVAEKSDKKGLGDEGTPAFKSPDDIIPNGKKSNDTSTLKQTTIKSEAVAPKDKTGSGKPKVRVTEKPSGKNFGDLGTPVMMNRKHVHPMGEKPNYNGLTTEDFVKQTKTMTTAEFISAMLAEGADDLDDLGSDDDADAPSFGDMDDDDADPDMGDDDDDDLGADDEEEGDDDDLGDETPDIPPMRCQYTGRSVTPAAHEVTKYMAHMLPHNERAVRMFVQELKSVPGALGSLMGEMVGHSELYDEMVNQIGVGKTKVARRFVKAMQENHQKFMQEMGMLQSDPSMSESVSLPMSQRLPSQSLTPQTPAATNQPGAAPMGGAGGAPAPAMIQDQPGDGTAAVSPIGKAPVQGQEGTRSKLNKEFAYHHMIKEMKKYGNMAQTMREILGG